MLCIKVFKRRTGLGYIDKQFQFTMLFYIHYPTRDLQRSYRLAINNYQLSKEF